MLTSKVYLVTLKVYLVTLKVYLVNLKQTFWLEHVPRHFRDHFIQLHSASLKRSVGLHFQDVPRHFKGVALHFKGVCIHFNGIPRHFKGVGLHFKGHTLRFVLFAAPYSSGCEQLWPELANA